MFKKHFIIASLHQSFPNYLTAGKAPLFDNFQVTDVWFHFSVSVTGAIRCASEVEAEVWIGGILYLYPRYAPMTVIPVYDLETLIPPG